MDSSPQELELTPELLAYAQAVALTEAKKHCAQRDIYDDVVQEAILHLLSKPPKFDPSRGTSEKTLIYTVVQRAVIKAAAREARYARRYKQFDEPDEGEDPPEQQIEENRRVEQIKSRWSMDDILAYVDNEESRKLCRLVIECGGNVSKAARRLGLSEGTVRHRLKMLAPKLSAAGFNPFRTSGGPGPYVGHT